MRIAIFVKTFPVITQTFILNQITGLIQRGHDVTIIAMQHPTSTGPINRENIGELVQQTMYLDTIPAGKIRRIGLVVSCLTKNKDSFKIFLRSCNFIKYGRKAAFLYFSTLAMKLSRVRPFDIIHCQFATIAPGVAELRDIGAIQGKLVTSFRGFDITERINGNIKSYKYLFSTGDLFLPVCSYFKSILLENGCHPSKIEVLHSGIDVKGIPFRPKKSIDKRDIRIISVGRLVEKKGFRYAIAAIAELLRDKIPVRYTIIGEGEHKAELERSVCDQKLDNYVSILDWKLHADVIDAIGRNDIMIVPSITTDEGDKEGIPNVLKEAMAAGVPVITTNHSGIPELVTNKETGLVVEEKDHKGIARSIRTLLYDPVLMKKIVMNARIRVEKDFEIDSLNERLVLLYEKLLD
jgi:colanic acid/amylovoran biosynthesis glycosyltransferase